MDAINFLIDGLIKKWRKPRWIYKSLIVWMEMVRCEEYVWSPNNEWKSIRELTSKESWLRQFVCENELLKPVVDIISICSYSHFTDDHDDCGWDETFPEYRIIESALKDETELESFLLDKIKI